MAASIVIDSVGPSEVTIDVVTQVIEVAAYQRNVLVAVPGPQGPPAVAAGVHGTAMMAELEQAVTDLVQRVAALEQSQGNNEQ